MATGHYAQRNAAPPAASFEVRHSDGSEPKRRVRLLIVEDDIDNAHFLVFLLQAHDFDVRVVHDGHDAMRVAKQFVPQLVLSDIELPDCDGYEVARELHAEPALAHTRLVAFTGSSDERASEKANEAGFERLLMKPVSPDELVRAITELV